MQPTTGVDENELQKAINSITNESAGSAEKTPVEAVADRVAAEGAGTPEIPAPVAPAVGDMMPPVAEETPVAAAEVSTPEMSEKSEGGADKGDLDAVKSKALSDLKPLMDKVELAPEQKFKIYREIIEASGDRGVVEPAYEAVAGIADEKDRAEALLFILETIDKLG